jgi:hypothetical protein
MDLEESGNNTRNIVYSPQNRDYWRALEGGIDTPGLISH